MAIENDLDFIGDNVEKQLDAALDSVKFGVDPTWIKLTRDYFEKKGYEVEIVAESSSRLGVPLGFGAFRYCAIVRKKA